MTITPDSVFFNKVCDISTLWPCEQFEGCAWIFLLLKHDVTQGRKIAYAHTVPQIVILYHTFTCVATGDTFCIAWVAGVTSRSH